MKLIELDKKYKMPEVAVADTTQDTTVVEGRSWIRKRKPLSKMAQNYVESSLRFWSYYSCSASFPLLWCSF